MWDEERIYCLAHFKKYWDHSFSPLDRELASPLTVTLAHVTNELFQFVPPRQSFGEGSLSSEALPAASSLLSQARLCASASPGRREPITLVWGLPPEKWAGAPAWGWRWERAWKEVHLRKWLCWERTRSRKKKARVGLERQKKRVRDKGWGSRMHGEDEWRQKKKNNMDKIQGRRKTRAWRQTVCNHWGLLPSKKPGWSQEHLHPAAVSQYLRNLITMCESHLPSFPNGWFSV